ncbi:hypothetical protein HK101_008987 [Irineochytrium annulatum]|nr:hypothetical protein HK101_008987 [Irineochytrium annulatum]
MSHHASVTDDMPHLALNRATMPPGALSALLANGGIEVDGSGNPVSVSRSLTIGRDKEREAKGKGVKALRKGKNLTENEAVSKGRSTGVAAAK